jgi:hypothetical protein
MTHTLEGGPDTNVTNVFVTNVSGYKANRAGKTNWILCYLVVMYLEIVLSLTDTND